jgi:hypothetical protein
MSPMDAEFDPTALTRHTKGMSHVPDAVPAATAVAANTRYSDQEGSYHSCRVRSALRRLSLRQGSLFTDSLEPY